MTNPKSQPDSNEARTNELKDEQLDEIVGGLNPQPLPPRFHAVRLPEYFFDTAARGLVRF